MTGALGYIIAILLLAVAVILSLGLINMLKGGAANRSQKLMRMRVAVQFIAVIALVLAVYLGRG